MYLVYFTRVGDGGRIRKVEVVAIEADGAEQAKERLHRAMGEGYVNVVKVEVGVRAW